MAVGDVTGHGIGAALLMATTRALLRSRAAQPGGPSAMVTDLNRRLCDDAASTGNFVSLFILFLDTAAQEILRQILQAIDDFRHDAPQQDDITLVVIKPA